VLVLAVGGCSSGGGDDGLTRQGSKPATGSVTFGDPAIAYRITYRVRAASGVDVTESTETISARRPFDSRVEIHGKDGTVVRRVGRFGALVLEGDGGVRVLAVPPSLGTSDVRPDAALDDAVDRGMAAWREVREVAGRRCRVYRLGSTSSDGTLVPLGTDDGEYADLCVDERGLVLEEWWVKDGVPLRQRLATDVEDDASFGASTFRIDGEPLPGPADGEVIALEPEPGQHTGPTGFTSVGRFAVTSARIQQSPSAEIQPARTSVVDVWRRGADFVARDRSPDDVGPSPYGVAIDVPGVGSAELVVDLRASELRIPTPAGTERIYGTLSSTELVAVARQLILG
jgi:hypothetical protein